MLNFKQTSVVVSFCALIIGHNAYSNDNNIGLDTTVIDNSAPLPEIAANNDKNTITETNNNESLTWPLLPGESLTDTAKQFYPKNKQQQQLFIKKALSLNADRVDGLNADTIFDEATLLNIPSLKTIAKQSKANKRKPKKKSMQLSYRIKDVVEGVPAYLMRQYEELLAKNSFLKIEIEKLNKKIEFLQNKIFDLKLVLDKTLDLSTLNTGAMTNADIKNTTSTIVPGTATTIDASIKKANTKDANTKDANTKDANTSAKQAAVTAKPSDALRNFDVTIIPNDKAGVVDLNAKKVFKNLDVQQLDVQKPATANSTQLSPQILPQATAPTEEPSTSFIENNKNSLMLALGLVGLLGAISLGLKKYRQRMFKNLSSAIPDMIDTVTDFGGYWQDTELDLKEPQEPQEPAMKAGFVNTEMRVTQNKVASSLEEAKLLMSVNRSQDAIAHLKATIAAHPKSSINSWLYLLEVFRKLNFKDQFEDYALQLHNTFNVMTPVWYETNSTLYVPQHLEEFPHIMEKLYASWPSDMAQEYLRGLITDNRGGDRAGFSKSALSEILLLISVLDNRQFKPLI